MSRLLATSALALCLTAGPALALPGSSLPYQFVGFAPRGVAQPVGACDWTSAMTAWWDLEEATNTSRAAQGTCGTDCTLNESSGDDIDRDATNFREGVASASFLNTDTEELFCLDATCDELDFGSGTSLSWGAWIRVTTDGSPELIENDTSGGYALARLSTNDNARCVVSDASTSATDTSATNSVLADGTWYHAVCVFDNTADTLELFLDATGTGGTSTTQDLAAGTADFSLGQKFNTDSFNLDEAFVTPNVLTDAEVCRICSCGIDGSLCTHSNTCGAGTYTNPGRNASLCGSCTLPATDALPGSGVTTTTITTTTTTTTTVPPNVAIAYQGGSSGFANGTCSGSCLATGLSTTSGFTGNADWQYFALVSTKESGEAEYINTVTGMGVTWQRIDDHCGGRAQDQVHLFKAIGNPSGGVATATWDNPSDQPSDACIVIFAYEGLKTSGGFEGTIDNLNTNGSNAACSGPSDSASPSGTINVSTANSVVMVVQNNRGKTLTAGSGWTKRFEVNHPSGGTKANCAMMDQTFGTTGNKTYDGTLSASSDWTWIAQELLD